MASINFQEGTYGFFADMDYDDLVFVSRSKPMRCWLVCYLAQQCIEKYLKQVAREDGMSACDPIIKGHNLICIAQAVEYPKAEEYRQELLSLGKLYFEGRYPNEEKGYMFVEPTQSEAERALKVVEDVRSWAFKVLKVSTDDVDNLIHKWDFRGGKPE